jgi:RNA polymerase sigma-70 factor (ECF subfamily)
VKARSDDRVLIARVAVGDRLAFEELYHRYYQRLFGFLLRLTRRPPLVEELLQETLLAVWRSADRFAGRSAPSTWILGIAYHQAMKALNRASEREPPADLAFCAEEPPPPDLVYDRRERAGRIGRALAQLSAEQRSVVELTFVQGFTYPEIAEILDCPVNTVKTRMFHARRRLRELLPAVGIRGEGRGPRPAVGPLGGSADGASGGGGGRGGRGE